MELNDVLERIISPVLFTFSHLADAFIQMRTIEAIKINKRAMIHKCYDKFLIKIKK